MFIGIGGERGEGFQFPDGCQPRANLGTELLLPSFGGEEKVGAQECDAIERPEEEVVAVVQIFDGMGKPANGCRRRHAAGVERCLEGEELGGSEWFLLEKRKDAGEELEISGCIFHCAGRGIEARTELTRPAEIEECRQGGKPTKAPKAPCGEAGDPRAWEAGL